MLEIMTVSPSFKPDVIRASDSFRFPMDTGVSFATPFLTVNTLYPFDPGISDSVGKLIPIAPSETVEILTRADIPGRKTP